jgi:hypothetical protein
MSVIDSTINHESTIPTCRGVIVVDASSLLRLVPPLNKHFLVGQGHQKSWINGKWDDRVRMSDGLLWLAKNGYEVIIPEMVAFECGTFLNDGQPILGRFPKINKKKYEPKLAKDFFQQVKALEAQGYPIHIVTASEDDKSTSAKYLREFHSLLNQENEIGEKRLEERVGAFFWIGGDRGKHAGDTAVLEYIKHKKGNAPIFCLSGDIDLLNKASDSNAGLVVNRLSEMAFYEAIKKAGMLGYLGIKSNVSTADIFHYINRSIGLLHNKMPFICDAGRQEGAIKHGSNFLTRYGQKLSKYIGSDVPPFHHSMKQLAEEVDLKPWAGAETHTDQAHRETNDETEIATQIPPNVTEPPGYASPADKFKQRYRKSVGHAHWGKS